MLRLIQHGPASVALRRPAQRDRTALTAQVAGIIARVRDAGDEALRHYTARFDKVELSALEVSGDEWRAARDAVRPETRADLGRAAQQVRAFHAAQASAPLDLLVSDGVRCERRQVAIERIGIYVPGGSAPLPSTLLMVGVPSQLAGCPMRVVCTPPRADGSIDPHILAAAELCGIERVFKLGGAQAVAALAFGTASVPAVDKLFGPGNAWVTEAKLQVAADPDGAALDLPAGPSEVLVVADAEADPVFVACDLLSQAEHSPDAQVVLVTTCSDLRERVVAELRQRLTDLPRRAIAAQSLEHSVSVLVPDLSQALEVANAYAPEHLILQTTEPRRWAAEVRNAGSVFLGPWTPEAVGDYATGTNHVLPTYGFARAWSGLGLEAFYRQITFQELTPEGLADIGPVAQRLSQLEGLRGHGDAVAVRLDRIAREARGPDRARAGRAS